MKDQFQRTIDYARISITDRCNLYCTYCRPDHEEMLSHGEILRYEEILRVCKILTTLGIGEKLKRATFMPFAIRSRRTSPLSVEGPRVQMIFVFLIKYLQRSRYNALYLDAAAQAGCSLAGSDCFAPAAAVYANMAVSTNHTTIHYKLLDTIAQEKSLQRNC